jgi:hypothetical protein
MVEYLLELNFFKIHGNLKILNKCRENVFWNAGHDTWTKLLIRSKDNEGRGIRMMASDGLEKNIAQNGQQFAEGLEYIFASLIVPTS